MALTAQRTVRRPDRAEPIGSRIIRHFDANLEVRDSSGLEFVFEGLASRTNTPYSLGPFEETISSGAFSKTLSGSPDVCLNANHGEALSGLPLARTTNGSLILHEDSEGLKFTAQLNRDDPDAQILMSKVQNKLLTACSFAFRVIRDEWSDDGTQRTIKEVDLRHGDVSVVATPANPATSVTARAAQDEAERLGKLDLYLARLHTINLRGRAR